MAALTLFALAVCVPGVGVAPAAAQEAPLDPYGPYAPYGPSGQYAPRAAPVDPYAGRALDPYTVRQAPPPDECSECAELQPQPRYAQPAYPLPAYRPVPPIFDAPRRPRTSPLLGIGLGLFSSAWAVSAIASTGTYRGLLAIPLAGPIIELVHLDQTYEPSFGRMVLGGVLALDAIAQTAGVIMAIVGGTHHRHVPPQQPTVRWSGAGVVGRF
ncbi:MAG: hypothetical protein ABI321_09780 [Polyangia bacterium]